MESLSMEPNRQEPVAPFNQQRDLPRPTRIPPPARARGFRVAGPDKKSGADVSAPLALMHPVHLLPVFPSFFRPRAFLFFLPLR